MKRLTNLLLATAMMLPATMTIAQDATEHLVRVEPKGYYPSIVYVQPGDTITFENKSGNWVRLYSEDPYDNLPNYDPQAPCAEYEYPDGQEPEVQYTGGKDGFAQGWFSNGSTRSFEVTSCMETRFYAPEVNQSGGTDWNKRFDLIVFGEAPNGS